MNNAFVGNQLALRRVQYSKRAAKIRGPIVVKQLFSEMVEAYRETAGLAVTR